MAGLANGSRRDFLKASAATAGSAALGPRAYARVRDAITASISRSSAWAKWAAVIFVD